MPPASKGGSGFDAMTRSCRSMVQVASAASVKPVAATVSAAPVNPAFSPLQLPEGAAAMV